MNALQRIKFGDTTSNITQALAKTNHPEAVPTLHPHLAVLWAYPALWENADFINWVAFDAATCIAHLIESGAVASDFAEQARTLSEHVCPENRKSCRNYLAKHYPWLTPK